MLYELAKGTLIYLLFADVLEYQKVKMNIVTLAGWGISHIIDIVLLPAGKKTVLAQKWNLSNAPTIIIVEGLFSRNMQKVEGKKCYILHIDIYIARCIQ